MVQRTRKARLSLRSKWRELSRRSGWLALEKRVLKVECPEAAFFGSPECPVFEIVDASYRGSIKTERGNARRRGAGSTASVGEPDANVGVAEVRVSGPLRANIVRLPRFSVKVAAARQYWQVIIIRDLRRPPVP